MDGGTGKTGHIHDIGLIIDDLENMGRLARVTDPVDPAYDLAGIAYRLEGGPRAVLFEEVAGQEWPVFAGLYWNRDLLADVLRQDASTLPQYVSDCIKNWQQRPVDPVVVGDGLVREVTEPDVDLTRMPIPIHATKDGGPYFDAGVVIARDPETGVRNASIQRFQVVDRDRLHVNIDSGRHLELYLAKAAERGESLFFTLNCGVGPGLHFAASAPAEAAPPEADELGIASEFHGAPVELVESDLSEAEMVAHAMWALECEMIPGEVANEGPFAEVTNYYAKVAPRPVVHVRRIHRRAKPVFQTILSGMEVWNSVGLLGEANVLALLQRQVPGVIDCYFSHGGCGFYHCIVQMSQKRAGWAKQAIMAAFAAFPPLKMVTVVDEDVDLRSAQDVEWAMATRLDPKSGIVTIDKAFGHGLNPSFPDYLGPKVGFDCTKPYPPTSEYERATYKEMSLEPLTIEQRDVVRPAVEAAAPLARPAPRQPESPPPMSKKKSKPAKATKPRKVSKKQAAWEAKLAAPAPADFTVPKPQGVSAPRDKDDEHPDDWIARPAPADFTVPKPQGEPARATGRKPTPKAAPKPAPTEPEDPDDWIARPAPVDLSVPKPQGGGAAAKPKPAPKAKAPARAPATRAAAKPAAKKAPVKPRAAAKAAPKPAAAKPAAQPRPSTRKKPTSGSGSNGGGGGGFFQGGGM